MSYFILKFLHVVGAAVLLGTGAGIAFFMLLAHRTANSATIAAVARVAVIAQPVTGAFLAWHSGYSLTEGWIVLSILLYLITGLFWLPVVWMQIEMRNLAMQAAAAKQPPPQRYNTLFRLWFAFGFPAFAAVLAIFWLMISRPSIDWFAL
ncbi:MAG: DUF2269 family protein [Mesorhizobium sp.]|nr:MAG: DUF2269 family protein [Mesorhizobium sp.]